MGKRIALLSGKGGCGKTTIGLCMAMMLSDCQLKVLLVDCDLCTHGATSYCCQPLMNQAETVCSFRSLVSDLNTGQNLDTTKRFRIGRRFDFIPSDMTPQKSANTAYSYRAGDENIFERKFDQLKPENYDVVIFDCQTGYSDILQLILPLSDVALHILEPDAVSRENSQELVQKTKDFCGGTVRSVFNKAPEGEFGESVHSDHELQPGVTAHIRFDRKIGEAIIASLSSAVREPLKQVPADMKAEIYKICEALLKNSPYQEKLRKGLEQIRLDERNEKKKSLEEEKKELNRRLKKAKNTVTWMRIVLIASMLIFLVLAVLYISLDQEILAKYAWRVYSVAMTVLFGILFFAFGVRSYDEAEKEQRSLENELVRCKEDLKDIYVG